MFKIFLSLCISIALLSSLIEGRAQAQLFLSLPEPGTMVSLSPAFEPVLIKGLKIHPDNPFKFDFIIDTGSSTVIPAHTLTGAASRAGIQKLVKYFLASLTIPEKDLWVNLSPYEKARMISPNLGQTEMGRDMLAQDYMLKQLTASLIYPEKGLGKVFWDRVYAKVQQVYGELAATKIPVNTFNKVWIVADKADVYEHGNVAYIVDAHLKVMLEEDYLAANQPLNARATQGNNLSTIMKDLILPEIEREINTGKNFAPLRQMFYSMILASWYKLALKDALLTQIYGNQSKLKGLSIPAPDKNIRGQAPAGIEDIYQRYLEAYKKGVFNYIKEDAGTANSQPTPRKYFSGGLNLFQGNPAQIVRRIHSLPAGIQAVGDFAMASVGVGPGMSGHRSKRVLVVTDTALNIASLTRQLSLEGYDAVFLNAGSQYGLSDLNRRLGSADLLVVALGVNERNTFQEKSIFKTIAANSTLSSLPRLVIRKEGSTEEGTQIQRAGLTTFLEVPKIEMDSVVSEINALFKTKQSQVRDRRVILLVDNKTKEMAEIKQRLQARGYIVITARGVRQALRKLNIVPYVDLVVSDFNMPGMNGLQLLGLMAEEDHENLFFLRTSAMDVDANARYDLIKRKSDIVQLLAEGK